MKASRAKDGEAGVTGLDGSNVRKGLAWIEKNRKGLLELARAGWYGPGDYIEESRAMDDKKGELADVLRRSSFARQPKSRDRK